MKDDSMKRDWTDKAAGKMAKIGIRVQSKFANGMSQLTRNMSTRKLKVLLVIFCLIVGGYSTFLFGDALFSSGPNSTINVKPLSIPQHANEAGDETLLSNQYVDEDTYKQIISFKRYMDSLKIKDRPLYESVTKERPGLMDSVQVLIEVYEEGR